MKYIITILFLCSPILALADNSTTSSEETIEEKLDINTAVPSSLKGKQLCVKDGDKYECVSTEQFKLVPRKQQFIVTKTKQQSVTTCQVKAAGGKNRISLLGGQGPTGNLSTSKEPGKATIESDIGVVGGVQYQRSLNDKWSVGGQLQTNKTTLFNLGYDF